MRARYLFAAGLLLACTVHAQAVSIVDPECIPRERNGVIKASVIPDPAVVVAVAPTRPLSSLGTQLGFSIVIDCEWAAAAPGRSSKAA